ncbi:MAG: hypothetical protein AVDCRST_MAG08-2298 [uncultured Acetobacteraceae bacterium]|uniref:Uncharacterized protein n=1 Tax=uncultured Acetobacteraceae bacterium TaxID=169975 RepID=A0A6J4INT7_9PROT|nr:MAG: hypothetical protein AVDCRST_MAG08-2298 [uncultured Acetobacteraceae bacterium]
MQGGERANDLDWEHVIEEIEDVGGSQPSAVKSHLGLAMLHALEALAWPGHPAAEHRQQETATFLSNAQTGSQPGMQQPVDPAALHARALEQLRKLPQPGGVPPRPLPQMVAPTAAELRDEEFGATDLLDRIRSAPPPARPVISALPR